MVENEYSCNIENSSSLHKEQKGKRLNYLESFKIKKARNNELKLINEHPSSATLVYPFNSGISILIF